MYRDYRLFLIDILISIKKIKIYTRNFNNPAKLKYSMLEWDATIREFEIIGEAANNLIKADIFGEEKRVIVDFRNILIHKYFGIDEEEVWQIIQNINELEKEILELIKKIDIDDIVSKVEQEYKNEELLDYLTFLKNLK